MKFLVALFGLGELKACYVVFNKAINVPQIIETRKKEKIALTDIPFGKKRKDKLVWPNESKKKLHGCLNYLFHCLCSNKAPVV